ncbi:MAG: (Fe-S)-binding protein [Thermoplasmata archaeon]|jgi:Fe-S oxidoreductase|nr:(Fe-S)-binding protein [Thermoplasmatales archaeon]PMP74438.1 MAG: hypothetical protein C0180_04135 [Aciduliprofundum sp.]
MINKPEDILAIASFVKETQLKYGNPAGIDPKDLSEWSRDLGLKRRGETIFYAGMYPYMGYAETALMLEYIVKKNGLEFSSLLNWLDKARYLGYEKNMKDLIRIIRSPVARLGTVAGISSDVLKKLREIAGGVDERVNVYNDILRKGVKVLKNSGIEFAYLAEEEPDSGVVLHTFGFLDEFKDHAKNVTEKFRSLGVKRIITMDPITGIVFKSFYPSFVEDFNIDVRHIVEVLKPSERKELLGQVVYHDPCFLARHWKLTEEPRKLMAGAGYRVLDPPNNRDKTRCDGGATEYQDPIGSVKQSQIRLNELLSTGEKNVVTSCPACLMLFRVGNYFSGGDARIIDIVELLNGGD